MNHALYQKTFANPLTDLYYLCSILDRWNKTTFSPAFRSSIFMKEIRPLIPKMLEVKE